MKKLRIFALMRKEIGKYLVDVSKLVFGGVVLSGIIKIEDVSKTILFVLGISATLVLAIGGFMLIKNNDKT